MKAVRTAAALILAALCGTSTFAQPAASYANGSAFYLAYRQAFDKATTIDELLPWVAKGRAEQIAKAPEELKDRTELDALIAYLQGMGLAMRAAK